MASKKVDSDGGKVSTQSVQISQYRFPLNTREVLASLESPNLGGEDIGLQGTTGGFLGVCLLVVFGNLL